MTPFAPWELCNDTGTQRIGAVLLRPVFRRESVAPDDPSLIDPGIGLPFRGVLVEGSVTSFVQSRTLAPGEVDAQFRAETRACTGGLVSERVLREVYGLLEPGSPSPAWRLISKPLTTTNASRAKRKKTRSIQVSAWSAPTMVL